MYGSRFPDLWKEWCDAYRDIYNKGGDICCAELKTISAPTLIVHGAKDAMVAGEHLHHLSTNIHGAETFVFPDGKHNLHFKYKEEFNQLVEKFLQS